MSLLKKLIYTVLVVSSITYGQLRDYKTHTRGMLWETVFNTGEIGRTFDGGRSGSLPQFHSMEWPGNSAFTLGQTVYNGFYNSFGGGIYIAADTGKVGNRAFYKVAGTDGPVMCGAVTDQSSNSATVENVYSYPISITRTENYPIKADGTLNSGYNPDEGEEIITAKWDTPIGVTVTRTSRAWSFPDYDDFIIYEYDLENTGNRLPKGASVDTLYEMTVTYAYSLCPSMISAYRQYGYWNTNAGEIYSRFDFKRFLWYTHSREGAPDPDYFQQWAITGENGGGLTAPASVGYMMLNYDHDHLAKFRRTKFYINTDNGINDNFFVWDKFNASGFLDPEARFKQPYLLRPENTNVYPNKITVYLDGKTGRKTAPFIPGRLNNKGQTVQDTSLIGKYWMGRAEPVVAQMYTQPNYKAYGFGPYILPPHEKIHFAVAEVAGYGAGLASDSVYLDYGGGTGDSPTEPGPYFHPVPSWYKILSYKYLHPTAGKTMGSDYLKKYPLPAYVNSNVISMKDVADRAIQMYNGGSLIRYNKIQYEPLNAPLRGVYKVPIPCPAPAIKVQREGTIMAQVTWNTVVETISKSTPGFARLNARLHHYEVLRSTSPIGPWTVLDSVIRHDVRYYNSAAEKYTYNDIKCHLNTTYYYAVVSVDSLGGRSGLTNLTKHLAQISAVDKLGKVYAAPNPFVISYFSSTSQDAYKIGFYGLPKSASINIYSYGGQLVKSFEHNGEYSTGWLQVSRNDQWVASGVYYFTVEDKATGEKAWGKFVIIH